MAKVAFIGDSHMGYRHRFKVERLSDFARSFEEAVEKALSESPDAVVFLGDIVHHPRPDPVSLRTVLRNLIMCAEKTNVVVLVGNHEIEGHLGTTYAPIYSDLHEKIHVLTSENPHVILDFSGRKYGFHGFEYTRSPDVVKQKMAEVSGGERGDVNILCLHQGIEGYVSPFEVSAQVLRHSAPKFDLIVAGHIHKRQTIGEISDLTPAYYVGSTERTSFNESSNPTGFMVFDGEDFRNPRYVTVSSKSMEYVKKDFNGTPEQLNRFLEAIISKSQADLLKVEVEASLDGDFLDVRRDFSQYEAGRTLLEVSVVPKSAGEKSIDLDRLILDEAVLTQYFEKTGNKNEKLREICLELFRKYGS
ncbi:MAG: metallophosphoesterase [Candidatus Altiarchaeota archaeon]|nr:metallophosphoesterase [Candidatus Altiarchaeota archaeon]